MTLTEPEEAKASALREDREGWAALVAALDAHPAGSVSSQGTPVWTARDAYAHMARWMDFNTHLIGELAAGRRFEFSRRPVDEINAEWQAADSGLSLAEARARATASYDAWQRTLDELPATKLTGFIQRVVRAGGVDHYDEHLGYMRSK